MALSLGHLEWYEKGGQAVSTYVCINTCKLLCKNSFLALLDIKDFDCF